MRTRHEQRSGVTLVEILVAMSVLSLVTLLLGASLRGLGNSAVRVDEHADAMDDVRVSVSFLSELLVRVSMVSLRGVGRETRNERLFEAAAEHVSWISVMPARFGASGRYAFRLAAEPLPDRQGQELVLRFAPLDDERKGFPDWNQAKARVLARGVKQFRISYGGVGFGSGWLPEWLRSDVLPPRLRIDVQLESGPWPPVVLPLRTVAPPKPVFTIGGGS